jgi:protein-disulfide isomerase/uncharacterized membrane protein
MYFSRSLALAGLLASALLLGAYLQTGPALCGYDSGCARVLSSRYSSFLGAPLPVIGLVAFGVVFAAALFPNHPVGRLLMPLSLAAGACGLALILLQVLVLGDVCPFCLVADGAALGLGGLGVARLVRRRGPQPTPERWGRPLWLAGAAVSVAVAVSVSPLAAWVAEQRKERVPPQVSALWAHGKVNIVEVVDFDCPHCRQLHAVLEQLRREEKGRDRAHFARVVVPMPNHRQARPAARAYLCAEKQGKGEAMAEALFSAQALTPAACQALAERLGLALPAYAACVVSPEVEKRLDDELAWVKEASPRGLPVVWVQGRRLSGPQTIEVLRQTIEAEQGR